MSQSTGGPAAGNLAPRVTVAVPSLNQARYLEQALESIFAQDLPVEVFVADAGSTDGSVSILERWSSRLAGWRSGADAGQAAAINEGIARGSAPWVCWLNSDDLMLPGMMRALVDALQGHPDWPAAYGRVWNLDEATGRRRPVWVEPFSERRLALRCIISQPGCLIRRAAWEAVGGLDPSLHMTMDYDLWWRLYRRFGPLGMIDSFVAVNRIHPDTKTRRFRRRHYAEAIEVVRRHHGRVPLKWWLAQPYAVWFKALAG